MIEQSRGPARRALAALAVGLVVAAVGCGKFREARECAAFARTVNTWISQAPSASPPGGSPERIAQDARSAAARYEALYADLGALGIEAEELKPRAERYREIAKKAAESLRAVADAVDAKDAETARKRRVEFDDVARGEAPLVAEINRICR